MSEQVLALDGQELHFCLDGAHSDVFLRVVRGRPGTEQAGRCAVRISHEMVGDGPWQEEQPADAEAEAGPIQALESGHCEFLNEEAVALIGPNEEGEPIKLALHLRFGED